MTIKRRLDPRRGLVCLLLLSSAALLDSLARARLAAIAGLAIFLSVEGVVEAVALDLFIKRRVEEPVVFLDERLMRAAVQAELAALPERLRAAVDPADEGLLVRVRVLVFAEVLRQREHLAAELAGERLLPTVDVVVPLQRELRREALRALGVLALVDPRGVLLTNRGASRGPGVIGVGRIVHACLSIIILIESWRP